MIKTVTVTNHLGKSLTIELMSPEKSGFIISNITGLGPGKADINSMELSTSDGAIYTSARVSSRNIVLTLMAYNDKLSVEELRLMSYQYFPIKKEVTLTFETDNRLCEIKGYVESNEPNIFSKEVSMQISILCLNPYFYSSGNNGITTTVFYGVDPMFEFPFSNESLDTNLLEFGKIKNETEQVIHYEGDAEIGVVIKVKALGDISNLVIYNMRTKKTMSINDSLLISLTGSKLKQGDELMISTVVGAKSITLFRNGLLYNVINCLNRDADWFQLSTGDNLFAYTVTFGIENLQFSIENRTLYSGV